MLFNVYIVKIQFHALVIYENEAQYVFEISKEAHIYNIYSNKNVIIKYITHFIDNKIKKYGLCRSK